MHDRVMKEQHRWTDICNSRVAFTKNEMDSGLQPQHLRSKSRAIRHIITLQKPFPQKDRYRDSSPMLQKLAKGLLALHFKKSHLGLKPFPLKSACKAISPMLLKVTNKLLALSFKIYSQGYEPYIVEFFYRALAQYFKKSHQG